MKRLTVTRRLRLLSAMALLAGCTCAPHIAGAQEPTTATYLDTLAKAEQKTTAKEWSEAAQLWQEVVAINPVESRFWNHLATAAYRSAKYRNAIPAYQKVIELGGRFPANAAYNIACCYALLGEKEQALSWLEQAFKMGYRYDDARTDKDLSSLHDDIRFRNLVGIIDRASMSRVEGWQYDLRFLTREVKRKGYSPFRRSPRDEYEPVRKLSEQEFDATIQRLNREIPRLSDAQIAIEMMKLLQKVGDGHTGMEGSREWPEFTQTLPVQFYLFEEGLFIIAADPRYRELLGAQVMKFGDRSGSSSSI